MPPRITLIVLAYNQHLYVEEAVRSCFAQLGEPLEILLSDDASTDGSYEVMRSLASIYHGPHRVRVRRNERNLGIGGHYNRAIEDSTGQLLITAAGDDVSLPHRVQALAKAWDATRQSVDLIASHVIDMTADGHTQGVIRVDDLSRWHSPDAWVRKRPYVIGASHAFTKRLHERFGLLAADVAYEDQVMALRACCLGGAITVSEPLLCYRRGGISRFGAGTQTPEGYLAWSFKKYSRQRALYLQIKHDLQTAGRSELWSGKVRRYFSRGDLALRLQAASDFRQRLALALSQDGAGYSWALRQAIYASAPTLAVGIKRWGEFLRRPFR